MAHVVTGRNFLAGNFLRKLILLPLLLGTMLALPVFGASAVRMLAQSSSISLSAYVEMLEEVAAELRDPALEPAGIEAALRPLHAVETVELATGELLIVDATVFALDASTGDDVPADDPPLDDDLPLEDTAEIAAAIAARLDVLRAELIAAPQDQTEARLDLLVDVLARPVFTAEETIAERIWRWLEARFYEWFPDWEPATGTFPVELSVWVGWIVVGLGALVLAVLASYWLQGIFANFLGGSDGAQREIPRDVPPSAAAARQQAQSAAEAGDYRQAVRRLYLAALLHLDEQRLLAFDRSLTNREVLAVLPDDSPVREHLRPVVDTFDAVWYGVREPDEDTYLRYRADIDALERMAQAAADGTDRAADSVQARGAVS
jgi:hypothetical protein